MNEINLALAEVLPAPVEFSLAYALGGIAYLRERGRNNLSDSYINWLIDNFRFCDAGAVRIERTKL